MNYKICISISCPFELALLCTRYLSSCHILFLINAFPAFLLDLLQFCICKFDCQALLVSGASDGLLVLWSADNSQDSRELVPKLSLKVRPLPSISITTLFVGLLVIMFKYFMLLTSSKNFLLLSNFLHYLPLNWLFI